MNEDTWKARCKGVGLQGRRKGFDWKMKKGDNRHKREQKKGWTTEMTPTCPHKHVIFVPEER